MRRTIATLLLTGLLAPAAFGQETPPAGPPATPPGQGEGEDQNGDLANTTTDRPLRRALAYEHRDYVEDLLLRPSALGQADAESLAREVSIPRAHAEAMIAAARGGVPAENLESLLRLGLPEGVMVPQDANLRAITGEQLKERYGLTEEQVRKFERFRTSAKRVHLHVREVQAVREAQIRSQQVFTSRVNTIVRGSPAAKVKAVADMLGLGAPQADAELSRERSRAERAENVARARASVVENARDMFANYRNADGTLDWKRLARGEAGGTASGMAHFAFALFLKELAITLKTGDRTRLEEFVDGLLSTDFFVQYGLFSVGASAADAMYGKYVRRLTRKRFLSGVLRSNIVLAAGIAVPMIARGDFSLDTYIVDVAALGLSATAVAAAVEGAQGVYKLVRGGKAVATAGRVSRLATPAGWVFTAAETAVVLILSDSLAAKFDQVLDQRAIRRELQRAQGRLGGVMERIQRGEDVGEDEILAAVLGVETAYDALRRLESMPLEQRMDAFRGAMEELGRSSLTGDLAVDSLARSLENNPALRRYFDTRYGSADTYIENMRRASDRNVDERMRAEAEAFESEWSRVLEEVYTGGPTTPENPAPAPGSRLATYDEETTILLEALDRTRDPEARKHIALAIERVRLARSMDRSVYESATSAPSASSGLSGAVSGN